MLNIKVEHFIVALGFIWIGLTLGISFFSAPIKFLTPGVPLDYLLAVGKTTFSIWLVMERWLIALLAVLMFSRNLLPIFNFNRLLFVMFLIVMFMQQFLIFPILDEQTNVVIRERISFLTQSHHYFVVLEVFKILILLGIVVFSLNKLSR